MNRRKWLKSGILASGTALWADGSLHFLSGAEETTQENAPALTLWQLPNKTPSQMMSYILKTASGDLIVIDGGTLGDADYLLQMIREIQPDGHVSLWLLSHIHLDHACALAKILKEKPDALQIDRICYDFPPLDWIASLEKNQVKISEYILDAYATFPNGGPLTPNEKVIFGNVEITSLNDLDLSITGGGVNASTIVYRVQTPKTVVLFLGDLSVPAGERLLKIQPAEILKADMVQMAHHGQQGVAKEFYDVVRPSVCLWPTPDWLWDNNSGKGPGSGPWKTVQNRAWMDDLGIKTHYVSKDGPQRLEIE